MGVSASRDLLRCAFVPSLCERLLSPPWRCGEAAGSPHGAATWQELYIGERLMFIDKAVQTTGCNYETSSTLRWNLQQSNMFALLARRVLDKLVLNFADE